MAISAVRASRRSVFECSSCGDEAPKWAGRCAACGEWNSMVEAPASQPERVRAAPRSVALRPASAQRERRASSGLGEVDRVLGGGFVAGSVVLLGGDPGVGKSTLALQLAAMAGGALYCTGEENEQQLNMRALRLGCPDGAVELLVDTDLDNVLAAIDSTPARLAIVDSVQTLADSAVAGAAGSPAQVRTAVARIVQAAKSAGVTVVLIGHVTKEGAIAGPRTLEHMVDVVLYLEGDRLGEQRLLRGVKNRFGSTGELGLLAMSGAGMRELAAPQRAFLDGASLGVAGNVLTVTCDGLRPLAVEVQALAVSTHLPVPRRTCSGFDFNRLCLLLAVLEKRGACALGQHDVFLNAAGGVRLDDPGVDLAVALAVAGARQDRTLPSGWVALGEVGLGGEIRSVARLDARVAEAVAAGATDALLPSGARIDAARAVRVHEVSHLAEAIRALH